MEASIITGLIAAAVTLVVAFLTQFVAEKFKRFHDGSALAAGIAGELSAYKEAVPHLLTTLQDWGSLQSGHQGLILRPMDRPIDVYYAASVGKIGLLGLDLVEDVVYVYSNINAFRGGMDLLVKSFKEMSPGEFRMRASVCYMMLSQANTRGERLMPKLRARANQRFF